jgi:signal transduction histidine kinase
MTEMIRLARKVAASEASSVLLLGESGTGKDLVAKAIHYGSSRAEQPFIAINCAAIPDQVLMNRCVNARDAMPHGGKLRIEAENVEIDEYYARMNVELQRGVGRSLNRVHHQCQNSLPLSGSLYGRCQRVRGASRPLPGEATILPFS